MVRVRARASNRQDLSLQDDMVAEQQASFSSRPPGTGGTERLQWSRIEFMVGTTDPNPSSSCSHRHHNTAARISHTKTTTFRQLYLFRALSADTSTLTQLAHSS